MDLLVQFSCEGEQVHSDCDYFWAVVWVCTYLSFLFGVWLDGVHFLKVSTVVSHATVRKDKVETGNIVRQFQCWRDVKRGLFALDTKKKLKLMANMHVHKWYDKLLSKLLFSNASFKLLFGSGTIDWCSESILKWYTWTTRRSLSMMLGILKYDGSMELNEVWMLSAPYLQLTPKPIPVFQPVWYVAL